MSEPSLETKEAIRAFIASPPARDVLSMMNFQIGPVAHLCRAAGGDIPPKYELEQAFVLQWMLALAVDHGDGWREAVGVEIDAMIAIVKAKRAPDPAP